MTLTRSVMRHSEANVALCRSRHDAALSRMVVHAAVGHAQIAIASALYDAGQVRVVMRTALPRPIVFLSRTQGGRPRTTDG